MERKLGSPSEKNFMEELTEKLIIEILPEESPIHEQCIYRVPPQLRQGNPKAYTPQIVSIGPFHNSSGAQHDTLKAMEGLKLKYLKAFLNRAQLHVGDFFPELQKWENEIRNCYAEPINQNSNDFLRMILIDASFIIELFLRSYEDADWRGKDPLLLKRRQLDDIYWDLILLENQLPLFVLEEIYKLAGMNSESPSFLTITFDFFQSFNKQNKEPETVCPKHFTDLLRTFMLPSIDLQAPGDEDPIDHVYSASQLSEAGLEFKDSPSKCLLELKVDKSVLTIPCINVEDRTELYFRNVLAFEQCHHRDSSYITQYISILDFLIKTEKDVNILVDAKIIVNWIGDSSEVARMIKNLSSAILLNHHSREYISLCNCLNEFYDNPCNKYKAIFIHDYFNAPWKIASTIAAVVLLLLTLIQTICSIISLFQR